MTEAARKSLPWNSVTIITVNLPLVGLLACAWATFGSVRSALSYANGDRLIADASAKSLGVVDPGKELPMSFALRNYSNRDIAIIGAKTSCACIATDGLPMTIPARSERKLVVKVSAPQEAGDIHERIYLYTNHDRQTELVLKIEGTARSRHR